MEDINIFLDRNSEVVETLFEGIEAGRESLIGRLREIAEIPAPTFQEIERSNHLADVFPRVGLRDIVRLPRGSVAGFTRSRNAPDTILLAAHLDTVFPMDTDLTTAVDGSTLSGPGTGDNAANVAAIITLAEIICERQIELCRNVAFCGTVCEEGAGNLAGMAEVLECFGDRLKSVIAVDGRTPYLMHKSQAIRRYRLKASGPGGHSWDSFGVPSAVHELARIICALSEIDLPTHPKTVFNVGTIHGGKAVNAVAQTCVAEVDLRSLERSHLERLERDLLDIVKQLPQEGISISAELAGQRPAAEEPLESPLVKAAIDAARYLGFEPELTASSTDAALSLARGISSISLGTYRGSGVHTLEEQVNLDSLTIGLKWLGLTLLRLGL